MLNIIGDLIALYVFESLIAVAIVTIIFTVIGQIIGFSYLAKEIPVNFKEIFKYGFRFYHDTYRKFLIPRRKG